MNGICRGCVRRQLRALQAVCRGYATAAPSGISPKPVPPPVPPLPPRGEKNAHSLRYKVDFVLTMENPARAEEILKQTRVPDAVYAWNLLIKYYAHQGKYSETERVYRQVRTPGMNN